MRHDDPAETSERSFAKEDLEGSKPDKDKSSKKKKKKSSDKKSKSSKSSKDGEKKSSKEEEKKEEKADSKDEEKKEKDEKKKKERRAAPKRTKSMENDGAHNKLLYDAKAALKKGEHREAADLFLDAFCEFGLNDEAEKWHSKRWMLFTHYCWMFTSGKTKPSTEDLEFLDQVKRNREDSGLFRIHAAETRAWMLGHYYKDPFDACDEYKDAIDLSKTAFKPEDREGQTMSGTIHPEKYGMPEDIDKQRMRFVGDILDQNMERIRNTLRAIEEDDDYYAPAQARNGDRRRSSMSSSGGRDRSTVSSMSRSSRSQQSRRFSDGGSSMRSDRENSRSSSRTSSGGWGHSSERSGRSSVRWDDNDRHRSHSQRSARSSGRGWDDNDFSHRSGRSSGRGWGDNDHSQRSRRSSRGGWDDPESSRSSMHSSRRMSSSSMPWRDSSERSGMMRDSQSMSRSIRNSNRSIKTDGSRRPSMSDRSSAYDHSDRSFGAGVISESTRRHASSSTAAGGLGQRKKLNKVAVNYDQLSREQMDHLLSQPGKTCDQCGIMKERAKTKQLFKCSKCDMACYCSEKCQAKAWTEGHELYCRKAGVVKKNDFMQLQNLSSKPAWNGQICKVLGPAANSRFEVVRIPLPDVPIDLDVEPSFSVSASKLGKLRPLK